MEAELDGDFGEWGIGVLQHDPSGLDARLDNEGLRADAEGFVEVAVELARGEVYSFRQLGDGELAAKVVADVFDHHAYLIVVLLGADDFGVTSGDSHDADHLTVV